MIVIRAFSPEEWRRYRDLRLRALADSPDAFGSTYEVESRQPDGHWQRRLQDAAGSASILALLAEDAGEAIGLCWGRIDPDDGVAHVFQMWVAPSSRGKGIASRLLETVLDWVERSGVKRVTLNVTCDNVRAERIYTGAGFIPAGEVRPLREGSAVQVQPMSLIIEHRKRAP